MNRNIIIILIGVTILLTIATLSAVGYFSALYRQFFPTGLRDAVFYTGPTPTCEPNPYPPPFGCRPTPEPCDYNPYPPPICYPTATPTLTATPTSGYNFIHIPFVYKPNLTPSPVLFPNGDFEQGSVIWEEYSSGGYELIYQKSDLPVSPYDGEWAAWLGGALDEDDYIEQSVLIPPNHPYMVYWYWIVSTDYCGYDVTKVIIGRDTLDSYWLCQDNNTNGWKQKVYDLRTYSGQTISILVSVETDLTFNSHLFLDHFTFQTSLASVIPPSENIIDIDASALKIDILDK